MPLGIEILKEVLIFAGTVAGEEAIEEFKQSRLVARATRKTASAFPNNWYVEPALKQWTKSSTFDLLLMNVQQGWVEGLQARAVTSFIKEGDFATGDPAATEERATEVISAFLQNLQNLLIDAGEEGRSLMMRHLESKLDAIEEKVTNLTGNPEEALTAYCQHVFDESRHLPSRGLDRARSDPTKPNEPLGLDRVYVALRTTTMVPKEAEQSQKEERRGKRRDRLLPGEQPGEQRPLLVLEAALAHPRLVVLGEPGSGKSTFLRFLALSLAGHHLKPGGGYLDRLTGWPLGKVPPVPIPVVLRDFAQAHPGPPRKATPRHLWDFITAHLADVLCAEAADPLAEKIKAGEALLLLDGLDEIPTEAQRRFVRDAIRVFLGHRAHARCRAVVSCRVRSYEQLEEAQLHALPQVTLAAFDEGQIDTFITHWYDELARCRAVKTTEAWSLAKHFKRVVRRADLWRLASNPLLLTVMALVHTHKGRLPEARALLYEETVEILLWRWDQIKAAEGGAPPLQNLLHQAGRSEVDLKRTLWTLAFDAHKSGGQAQETPADIGELQLEKALAALNGGDRNWAVAVIGTMKLRAGLLVERLPEVYTLPHRTFQEYLAGAHLARQDGFATKAEQLAGEGPLWREVILLAAGKLVHVSGDTDRPLGLVERMCLARAQPSPATWRKAVLAGEVLLEIGLKRVADDPLGAKLLPQVQAWLVSMLGADALSPKERTDAGALLGRIGDPRAAVLTVEALTLCYVPAGPFAMGSDNKKDDQAFNSEQPEHPAELKEAYWVSQYPVTQAQFAVFVQAGGYGNKKYWTKAGWQRREREEWEGPRSFGEPFDLPNHPVVGVSWYEAVAFTQWLTERLHDSGALHKDWIATLPSEAEWEKAARGGREVPENPVTAVVSSCMAVKAAQLSANPWPTRRYPWGEEADPSRANYRDTGIGTTSAVGCFPGGASLYGAEEMSGNVWEWTRSLWGKSYGDPDYGYPYNASDGREDLKAGDRVLRVLRGGSFDLTVRFVRCAARYYDLPDLRDGSVGFRIFLRPFSGSLVD